MERGGGLFVQIIALLRESGYFDTAAVPKPLLHLSSLAVEERLRAGFGDSRNYDLILRAS